MLGCLAGCGTPGSPSGPCGGSTAGGGGDSESAATTTLAVRVSAGEHPPLPRAGVQSLAVARSPEELLNKQSSANSPPPSTIERERKRLGRGEDYD